MKNAVADGLWKVVRFVSRNKGTILTVVGSVGVVVTGLVCVNAGLKANDILREYHEEQKKPATLYEKYYAQFKEQNSKKKPVVSKEKAEAAKRLLLVFTPCILSAGATIACIIFADATNKRTQAALSAAYMAAAKALTDRNKATEEIYGEEANRKIEEQVSRNYILNGTAIEKPEGLSADSMLYYDAFSKRYFWSTEAEVLNAEYELNRMLVKQGVVSLNDWYEMVGLEQTPEGNVIGWDQYYGEIDYGYQWIDFEHHYYGMDQLDDKADDCDIPPYCVIHFPFPPHPEPFEMHLP